MTLWQHRSEYHHAVPAEHVNHASDAATRYLDVVQATPLRATQQWALVDNVVNREALTLAINDVFWACAILFVALIPVIWLARPPFASAADTPMH